MLENYTPSIEAIIAELSQSTDKLHVLSNVLTHVLTISQVEIGALLVTNDKVDNLTMVIRQGMPDELVKRLQTEFLGKPLLAGQTLWLAPKTMQLDAEQALLKRHQLQFVSGIPLRFHDRVLGALVVASRQRRLPHRPSLERCLQQIAALVAIFLDNIQLRAWQQKQERQQLMVQQATSDAGTAELEELLAAVMTAEEEVAQQNSDLGLLESLSTEIQSTQQLDTILDVTLKRTVNILQADAGWCYLLEGNDLVMHGHYGLSGQYIERMQYLLPGNGAEGMAFNNQQPLFADGLLYHSGKMRRWVMEEQLLSVAALPLKAEGQTIGVLAVATHQPYEWSMRGRRMLLSISQKVAQAVLNARHLTQAETRATTWQSNYNELQQVNDDLVHRTRDLEQQVAQLQQTDHQLWAMLAASREISRQQADPEAQEMLRNTLKKALEASRVA